jgi:phage terminase large subunit-like protein
VRDLARAGDLSCPFVWDPWHAADACAFVEKLPHIEGRWSTATITLEPVQVFILSALFGWRRRDTGGRRFSMAYIAAARKFAKSTLAAAIALYCLTCEGEAGPQIIIAATTGQQAEKVFRPAREIVRRTPDLRDAFGLEAWAHAVTCADNGGFLQTINAKGSTQDGWNPYLVVLDELHAHASPALFNVLRSSFGSRPNQLMLIITTAGFNVAGVCYEQQALVQKILEGTIEADHYFGVIFAIDDGDDPFDEAVWIKANPMLGITPTLEKMREYAVEAKQTPPSLTEFVTKRCNRWSGAAQAWLNLAQWDACADPGLTLEAFEGAPCWIGLDLSDCNDMTAAALVFARGAELVVFPTFYLPALLVEAAPAGVTAHYAAWARAGLLELTEGNAIDHNRIAADVRAWAARFAVRAIVGDRYQASQLMTGLATEGLPATVVAKNAVTWTPPAQELEKRVRAGTLRHTGHAILRWNAANVCVSRRLDKSLVTKKDTVMSAQKIDGIDAAIQALGAWIVPAPPPPSYSVYVFGGSHDTPPRPPVAGA